MPSQINQMRAKNLSFSICPICCKMILGAEAIQTEGAFRQTTTCGGLNAT